MEKNFEQLSKKERRLLHQAEKRGKRRAEARRHKLSRLIRPAGWVVGAAAILGLMGWYIATRPVPPASEIVSQSGLHWHPELSITVQGKKQEIPSGLGLGVIERSIHTHDATGQIHLEFQGPVSREDLRLGQFFKVWGKTFNRNQVLDYTNGPAGTVKMFVNGQPNDQFENYVMQDKDRIEIKYEK